MPGPIDEPVQTDEVIRTAMQIKKNHYRKNDPVWKPKCPECRDGSCHVESWALETLKNEHERREQGANAAPVFADEYRPGDKL